MWENGGPGVWAPDYREIYDLKDDSWKFDAIPEIMDGKNIADFVDPDIDAKLQALELEEEQIMAELQAAAMGEESESDLDSEEEAAVEAIRDRKKTVRLMSRSNLTQNKPMMSRAIRGRAKDRHDPGALDAGVIKKKMDSFGVDTSKMLERARSKERGRKRERSLSRGRAASIDEDRADIEMQDVACSKTQVKKAKRAKDEAKRRESSLARSHSRPRDVSQVGLKDVEAAKIAEKLDKQGRNQWHGASGEGDKRKAVHLVKWMNTGKKRNGTHYCR
jgi:nucleolar GTP-binding protein